MTQTLPPAGRPRRLAPALAALIALAPIACGSDGPPMARVYGKVTYQGKPLAKGTVTFQSNDPQGRNATGEIDADGNYTLQTETPGDGAQVGGYLVAVSARDEPILDYTPRTPIPPKRLVPAKYENPATSGLMRAVSPGGNAINLDLVD